MHYQSIQELYETIRPLGRTLPEAGGGTLWCDWTLSGVELRFRGTTLLADLTALPGAELDRNPFTGAPAERPTWPWCAVILDGAETPSRVFEVPSERETCLLLHSGDAGTHTLRLVKRTENGKGFLGIRGFWLDGELLPPEPKTRREIVFIGDSITCGFGNSTEEKDRLFFAQDEDGWLSHGAIAARLLDLEPTIVGSSGIALTTYAGWPHPYAMDRLYDYADRMLEDKLGVETLTPWDFAAHPADYVVLNLGTNDVNAMALEGPDGAAHHARAYEAFLRHLREVHPQARLICALGSMDYYLYSDIERIVAAYRRDTGDRAVFCFRYPKMDIADPVGACGHPHVNTHRNMARALAGFIAGLDRA